MLTRREAAQIAEDRVARSWEPLPAPDNWILVEGSTVERPWGWVFVFSSRLWFETKQEQYAVAGNVPLLVERATSKVIPLGTARPIEQYVHAYELHGDPHAKGKA